MLAARDARASATVSHVTEPSADGARDGRANTGRAGLGRGGGDSEAAPS
jgi:hypothetical protein